MYGMDLDRPIEYCYASMRYFREGEHHVTRTCREDVLLLVYEGVLRFEEEGVSYELHPGQYHIQKQNTFQQGREASSSPRYLYVHFLGTWADGEHVLPADGTFSCEKLFETMEKMDYMVHNNCTLTECAGAFFQILTALYQDNQVQKLENYIADYIARNLQNPISLELLAGEFNYSKNHIINIFKRAYQMTPVEYLIDRRVKRAEWLLEATGDTLEKIAEQCGFSDYSHFYKAFVKIHGKTPGQWRREKQVKPY